MTNNVYIGAIIDKSGSMSRLAADSRGGFNRFLREQQEQHTGKIRLVTFNTKFEEVYSGDLAGCPDLTSKNYWPSGFTAYYDAIGWCISEIGKELGLMKPEERPAKVVIAILTDGLENSSVEYDEKMIRAMIEHQERKYNWTFIFLGANMDASVEGTRMGIAPQNTYNFTADREGTAEAYSRMSRAVTASLMGKAQNEVEN